MKKILFNVNTIENSHEIKDGDNILENDYVKSFSSILGFYCYAIEVISLNPYHIQLVATYDYNQDYNGPIKFKRISRLINMSPYETNIKMLSDVMGGHKPTCWMRKYKGNEDLLTQNRDHESKMRVLKELGWSGDDIHGIKFHCDCGWDEIIS